MKKGTKRVLKILLRVTAVLLIFLAATKMYDQKTTIRQQRATIERQKSTIASLEGSAETAEETEQAEDSSAEQELEEARNRITELEQQISSGVEDNTYLRIKFHTDGYYYKNKNDSVTFYFDPTCTEEISEPIRFMSKSMDSDEAENGLAIYCLKMDNGKICYCPQNKGYPDLITEEEYNQIKAEEAANQ